MSRLAKGEVIIDRKEFFDAFGLPENVEIIELDFGDDGITVKLMSADPIVLDERPLTHRISEDGDNTFRRRKLINRYKPKGKEIW